ncbi:MAG: cell division protein ZapA [Methylohalobius crimeensis]|uniref:cell division protein ZapA n=1 Tax=Methylohalobius crimeensis TaxID=244365 RepID=UPI0003B79A39|nr:cell division protein ZapA [Methylohalobius crimeensis]
MNPPSREAITIHILGREYKLRCDSRERDRLISAAERLDAEMRAVRAAGNTIGTDRIAIMAALNIAHELIQQHSHHAEQQNRLQQRIGDLNQLVDQLILDKKNF